MPFLLPVLALATLGQAAQPPALDSFTLGEQTVAAKIPPDGLPHSGEVEFKGWNYEFSSDGRLIGRRLGKGGGEEIARLYATRATTPVAEWRTKIILFDDVDILGTSANGVMRERRSGYFGPDLHGALDAIALFGSMVEAYSGGKLKFVPDLQIESDSMRFEGANAPFNEAFIKSYLGPRVNGGFYDSEDKIYRGPYNSIFFLHFGLTDASCQTQVNDMPVTGFSYYFSFDRPRPQLLASRLFNAWIGHLLYAASRHGYNLGSLADSPAPLGTEELRLRLPEGWVTDSMWAVLANLKDTNDFGNHTPREKGAQPWSKVASDPWSSAAMIDSESIASEAKGLSASAEDPVNSNVPLAVLSSPNRSLFVCEPEYADFIAAQSAPSGDPLCLGYVLGKAGPKIVFEQAAGAGLKPPVLKVHEASTEVAFTSGDPSLGLGGYFKYKVVDDPSQGKAALVQEDWVVRAGWLRLFGGPIDPRTHRFLDLTVKSVAGSHSISVVGTQETKTYEIFGSDSPAPERTGGQITPLDVPADGAWRHVVVDLAGVGQVNGIYLTSGNAKWWHPSMDQMPTILIGGAKLTSEGTPTPVASNAESGDDAETKSRFLAGIGPANYASNKADVLKLLKDPSLLVQLNAANVYTRVKDRSAEDPLGELTKSLDSRIAQISMRALMAQGTDTGRGPVLVALTNGPFDANRYWAAIMLSDQKDPFLAESYSRLIASRSWQTRLAAGQALAKMPGDKPKGFLLAFLLETNPQNEVEIARLGPVGDDLFEKRMQWYAVNDPSDAMRYQCNVDLLSSALPGYPEEGIKGLHDDSWWVRKALLAYLAANSAGKWRGAIVASLADPNEEVRAAAVVALRSIPNTENLNDLANVRDDRDPRVQKALANSSN